MKYGKCQTCMWWWDLYETGERKCYRNLSPFFHEATKTGCNKHEDMLRDRKFMKLGYYKQEERK